MWGIIPSIWIRFALRFRLQAVQVPLFALWISIKDTISIMHPPPCTLSGTCADLAISTIIRTLLYIVICYLFIGCEKKLSSTWCRAYVMCFIKSLIIRMRAWLPAWLVAIQDKFMDIIYVYWLHGYILLIRLHVILERFSKVYFVCAV